MLNALFPLNLAPDMNRRTLLHRIFRAGRRHPFHRLIRGNVRDTRRNEPIARVYSPLPISGLLLLGLLACDQPAPRANAQPEPSDNSTCTVPAVVARLPAELYEASGVAASLRHPGIWWMLVDDGPARIMAIDSTGAVRATVPIQGARNRDWESLTSARCGSGSCLYIGDIGDNDRRRDVITVYRVAEPDLKSTPVRADAFGMRYPQGKFDAEAIFVLPEERLYLLTKGRSEPLTLYRYPGVLNRDSTVALQPIQRFSESFVQLPDMITGAGATADGKYIAIRTYSSLQLFELEGDTLRPLLDGRGVDLGPAGEFQGEGVDIAADGRIMLISEKGLDEKNAPISTMHCALTTEP